MLKKKFQKSSFRHSAVGKVAQNVAVYAFGPLLQLILISIILELPVSQKKGARLGDSMESVTKKAEASVHYASELLKELFEDSDEFFLVMDENGQNMASAKIFEIGSTFFVGYVDDMDGWKLLSREESKRLILVPSQGEVG